MDQDFPQVGLASEHQRLVYALRKRQALLLLGPAGSGKSRLIRSAIESIPNSAEVIHLRYSANLHHLLVDLARSLLVNGHRRLQKFVPPATDNERWLSAQTSVHLKGILWTSLEAEPRIIVLDGVDGGRFPTYRFLQRLYFAKGMVVLAAARDPASLGTLARLFWDPRITLHVRPLNDFEANRLFDLAVERFRLSGVDLDDFRERVLEAAEGNPGQIVEMCRFATNPIYLSGSHIKFAPLRIDVLMKFL